MERLNAYYHEESKTVMWYKPITCSQCEASGRCSKSKAQHYSVFDFINNPSTEEWLDSIQYAREQCPLQSVVVEIDGARRRKANEPVKQESGHWEKASSEVIVTHISDYFYKCSVCGGINHRRSKFCPDCGQPME